MGNGHGFTTGFFLGATMGAVAALLFAPKSGQEMRGGLSRQSERWKERAYGVANQIRERGEDAVRRTRRTAETTAERVGESTGGLGATSEQSSTSRPIVIE